MANCFSMYQLRSTMLADESSTIMMSPLQVPSSNNGELMIMPAYAALLIVSFDVLIRRMIVSLRFKHYVRTQYVRACLRSGVRGCGRLCWKGGMFEFVFSPGLLSLHTHVRTKLWIH